MDESYPEDHGDFINPRHDGLSDGDDTPDWDSLDSGSDRDSFFDPDILPTADRGEGTLNLSDDITISYSTAYNDTPYQQPPADPIELEPIQGRSLYPYRIFGPDATDMDLPSRYVASILTGGQYRTKIPGQAGLSRREVSEIPQIQEGIALTAAECSQDGAHITERFLSPQVYRPFRKHDRREYVAAADSSGAGNMALTTSGLYAPAAGVLWVRSGDLRENVQRMTFGTVLSAAVQWVRPRVSTKEERQAGAPECTFRTTQGYVRPDIDGGEGFNIMMTDMITRRTLENGGMDEAEIIPSPERTPFAALGSAVISHTADYFDADPLEIESLLTDGYFTGNPQGLQLVSEALGESMPGLLSIAGGQTYESAARWANELGLSEAIDSLNELSSTGHMTLYYWH